MKSLTEQQKYEREYKRRWRAANPEKAKETARRYYIKNRARFSVKNREYYAKSRDKFVENNDPRTSKTRAITEMPRPESAAPTGVYAQRLREKMF